MSGADFDDYSSDDGVFLPVIGTSLAIGKRASQQDRVLTHVTHMSSTNPLVLASVFDGHGTNEFGHVVAEKCSKTLLPYFHKSNVWALLEAPDTDNLKESLSNVVKNLERDAIGLNEAYRTYAGSTMCAVIFSTEILVSINVGDSRAVLASKTQNNDTKVIQLTVDHVPTQEEELKRVLLNGGWVENGFVNGYITMTRAIGDSDVKEHRNETEFPGKKDGQEFGPRLIVSDPDILSFKRDRNQKFLIVASDGIWGSIRNDLAVKIVDSSLRKTPDPDKAASTLVRRAVGAGSTDNCTAIVVMLSKCYMESKNKKTKGRPKFSIKFPRIK